MTEISRAALFGKLHPVAYRAVEGATVFCKLRGNPYVELAHWVHQILTTQDSDLHRIVRHFELDPARLAVLAEEFRKLLAGAADSTAETVARSREFDNQLHDLIWASAGNHFLAGELARLKTLFRAYRDVAWEQEEADNDFHRVGVEAREHLAL